MPNLISLFLTISGEILFDFADLANMVRSRRKRWETAEGTGRDLEPQPKPMAQMEAITVGGEGCESLPSPAVLAQFQELEDDGVKVHIEVSD